MNSWLAQTDHKAQQAIPDQLVERVHKEYLEQAQMVQKGTPVHTGTLE